MLLKEKQQGLLSSLRLGKQEYTFFPNDPDIKNLFLRDNIFGLFLTRLESNFTQLVSVLAAVDCAAH